MHNLIHRRHIRLVGRYLYEIDAHRKHSHDKGSVIGLIGLQSAWIEPFRHYVSLYDMLLEFLVSHVSPGHPLRDIQFRHTNGKDSRVTYFGEMKCQGISRSYAFLTKLNLIIRINKLVARILQSHGIFPVTPFLQCLVDEDNLLTWRTRGFAH